jgi:hypothetical protein
VNSGNVGLSNTLLLENIIGRLTHGLLGLDIYVNEKVKTQYLEDFLTLDSQELQSALTSTAPRYLVPNKCDLSVPEFVALVEDIEKAKSIIKNLEEEKPAKIDATVRILKKNVHLLYGAYHT